MIGDNVHIVFDGNGNPLWYTVSDTATTAQKKAENRTMKTWLHLSKTKKWTCHNVDITIRLRG